VGGAVTAQGVFGLAVPDLLLALLRAIQTPPVIYLAAVVRVAFGIILVLAAPASRTPLALRALGALIVVGGLISPFYGEQFGHAMLDWWQAGGPPLIRAWAGFSLVLGVLILWSVARRPIPARAAWRGKHMLQLRPCCECCGKDLPGDSDAAYICSFECTFCRTCKEEVLKGRCPNCGGELLLRPRRAPEKLLEYPASTQRIVKPDGCSPPAR